jgi:DDE domain
VGQDRSYRSYQMLSPLRDTAGLDQLTALLRSPIGRSRQARPVKHAARSRSWSPPQSAFAGFRFPAADAEGDPERGGHRRRAVYPGVWRQPAPSAWHHVEQDENNPIEADHGRLNRRLRPMRGLHTDRRAHVVIAGHAFAQNLRRGHHDIALDHRRPEDSPPPSPDSLEPSDQRRPRIRRFRTDNAMAPYR